MQFRKFDLDGLLEITPGKNGDERGYFSEIFRADTFAEHVGEIDFVQENQSLSINLGTIRGLHFQTAPFAQGKLVRCVAGAIFDVAVDLRISSPTFGRWAAIESSAEKGNQLWVPAGFAHGFCTLQANTIVAYKASAYYSAAHELGVAWDDRDIGIIWPEIADKKTLSPKDQAQPKLAELPEMEF